MYPPDSVKNIEIDFILSHMSREYFFYEDKIAAEAAKKDRKKAKYLRDTLYNTRLHCFHTRQKSSTFASNSCRFDRLKLQNKATKMIDGATAGVFLKEVLIRT